jgi:PTS system mannose-specific IIA component
MTGVVVVSHGKIGTEMVRIAKSIVREPNPMVAIAIEHDENVDLVRQKIIVGIKEVEKGDGVLLLSDLFGGTPSNLCLSFLNDKKVEVITGFNLPMLIKLASFREKKPLHEIASFIKAYGQKNIALAGEVLGSNRGNDS